MTTTMTLLVGVVANDEVHTVLLLRPVEAELTIEGLCLTTSKFKPHDILFSRSYLRVDMKCVCICVLHSNRSGLSHTPVTYAVKVQTRKRNKTNVTPEKDDMVSANQTPGGYKFVPLVASQQWRVDQHESACFGLSSPWSFPLLSGIRLHAVVQPWLSLQRSISS